ncbi:ABC transporter G family member 39-like [Diospyros lotus]|uniref:ABC transporter G family member 39-like n=1 Tax=Diospyros lotus TaxID=55363 RepID=UPI002257AAA8|nr:ABC transporter G family member 39-like [Diospyros lotus]
MVELCGFRLFRAFCSPRPNLMESESHRAVAIDVSGGSIVRGEEEHNQYGDRVGKQSIERASLDMPTIEVRFRNLNVDAQVYLGRRGLPTVPNSLLNFLEGYLHILPTKKRRFSILHDANGIIKPGRMTLLLGPPGAGKTIFLLALSGKLDLELKISGTVTYNGHNIHEFAPHRISSYTSQSDVHIAEMTVRETLSFSVRCQGVDAAYDMVIELKRKENELNKKPDLDLDALMTIADSKLKESIVVDYILKILGLEDCADTIIGNEMVRGVSGGQRKRVTIGEMLMGPARAIFMDNISTGLDSVTTFRIINSIKQLVHTFKKTAVISLLQPAPETYNLFDDIILLSEGHIVYQGPREYVLEFFESMGFKCPIRKNVADYLLEVTSRKDQKHYWANAEKTHGYISVNEFAAAFQLFHIGKVIHKELATPFGKLNDHSPALVTSGYATSRVELLRACISRECILVKRSSGVYKVKIIQHLILATIAATLFRQSRRHHQTMEDGTVYLGALYCSLIATLFTGFPELPMTIARLPVFYKQTGHFYPSWACSLPASIVRSPISTVEVAIWVSITYYAIGFDPTAEGLFRQFLLLALSGQMSYGLFRCIAGLSRDHNVANTGANIALVWLLVFSGFALSRQNMKNWLIWGYWTSPLMYVNTALSINEFLGLNWENVYNTSSAEPLGISILKSRGIFATRYWYWIGVGALVGFIILFIGIHIVAHAYLNQSRKVVFLSKEYLKERHVNITGETEANGTTEKDASSVNKKPSKRECSVGASRKGKGMFLPFIPLSITFENIRYSVDIPKESKAKGSQGDRLEILKGVSGTVRPGVLTALMGVSGAGKTTLLEVLAGRKNIGHIEGNINISGYPKKQKTFARISGYCEQNGIHSPLLTVYESLLFSAFLRLPSEVKSEIKEIFVMEVMEMIELTPLKDALVGFPTTNGLSIEQHKRLTVAVELVANPSIIFMDEPTTGLDSRAAAIVMRNVRNIVDAGRAVVCTVHQPSTEIFESFDELFLLSQGGEEIYVGPLGNESRHMIKYFEEIKGVPKIKRGYNPATWLMEVITGVEQEPPDANFSHVYKNSDLYRRNKALIEQLSTPMPNSRDLDLPNYFQPFLAQFKTCLWRQCKSYWRNTPYNSVRLLCGILTGFTLGIVFWGLGSRRCEEQDVLDGVGSMYMAIMFLATHACFSVLPVITTERAIFYRERAAGVYSTFPYAIAELVIEIPYILAQTLIYGITVYAMIGFVWQPTKLFLYLSFFFITILYYTYFGMMVVALTPNLETSASLCGVFFTVWNLFSGFLIPRPRIPPWWKWYEWACPVSWSLYGLASSQYGDSELVLSNGETVAEFTSRYFGYRKEFLGAISGGMIGFAAIFALVFCGALWGLNFQKR